MGAEVEVLAVDLQLDGLLEDHLFIGPGVDQQHYLQTYFLLFETAVRKSAFGRRIRRPFDRTDQQVEFSVSVPVHEAQFAAAHLSERLHRIVVAGDLRTVRQAEFAHVLDVEIVDLTVHVQGVVLVHDDDAVAAADPGDGRADAPGAVEFEIVHAQGHGSVGVRFAGAAVEHHLEFGPRTRDHDIGQSVAVPVADRRAEIAPRSPRKDPVRHDTPGRSRIGLPPAQTSSERAKSGSVFVPRFLKKSSRPSELPATMSSAPSPSQSTTLGTVSEPP